MSDPLDTITITSYNWDESKAADEGFVGLTAQELSGLYTTIDTTSSITIPTSTVTINSTGTGYTQYGQAIIGATGSSMNTTIGSNGTSFTFSDPYAEIKERLDAIEKVITEEAEIRSHHPAVQTAYDHYRLLLVLAGKVSPEDLTEK